MWSVERGFFFMRGKSKCDFDGERIRMVEAWEKGRGLTKYDGLLISMGRKSGRHLFFFFFSFFLFLFHCLWIFLSLARVHGTRIFGKGVPVSCMLEMLSRKGFRIVC